MKMQYTTSELESHIRVLQAELDSRKSATSTPTGVYARAGVSEENTEKFDEMLYALVHKNATIRELSTPTRDGFISGNCKNWVANLGGKASVLAEFGTDRPHHVSVGDWLERGDGIPQMVKTYVRERVEAGKGWRSDVWLEETGTYKGKVFGVIRAGMKRYFVGKLMDDKVRAYKEGWTAYTKVDKATKGHRFKCDNVLIHEVD